MTLANKDFILTVGKVYLLELVKEYFGLESEDSFPTNNKPQKNMIPFFYSHSTLSKYLVECLDFILKTEVLLSPRLSLRVRAGSYINRKGQKGKNKPADMEKENQVKFLKDLISGLGRWKTEQSIVKISKAGPVLHSISTNFDQMCGIKDIKSTHGSYV
ncbi:uncharacterized protein LOC126821499 [Patella vulgata]|uniref:uncharacterized protein LOC126821499 n=1 Tax=Patella vulgata TaxID=6465 RepID=UPI002180844F|nr:uncharacterized protein LOC126821499 [Patella vulgata]